jgi:hypothetical protein
LKSEDLLCVARQSKLTSHFGSQLSQAPHRDFPGHFIALSLFTAISSSTFTFKKFRMELKERDKDWVCK